MATITGNLTTLLLIILPKFLQIFSAINELRFDLICGDGFLYENKTFLINSANLLTIIDSLWSAEQCANECCKRATRLDDSPGEPTWGVKTKVVFEGSFLQDPDKILPKNNNVNVNSPGCNMSTGIGEPGLWHALIVIFLEFFSWGLLTVPVITVLAETFPTNKFLMNGLILGVKGLLSFLSAPLIGALSDIWGRKFFLLLTVFSTCMPIPLLKISPWWYFALFSISGIFSATFSVVLAYVADITDKDERNAAYGLVSATFGASLVTSPALGAYLTEYWSVEAVITLATAVACLDVFFIMVAVPESLPPKLRHSWDRVTWETADPFASLRMVGEDFTVMLLCVVVFLSYLPEAGQFSCFFVYLKLVVGFSPEGVAAYIGIVGILSVIAQTGVLMVLHKTFGTKKTIMFGLLFQFLQLAWYGLSSQNWMMWSAGVLAALSQISYPSISSFLSLHSDGDKQGTVQGMVTGIRGLCQGLGPALFGFIFYLFNVDLNSQDDTIRPPFAHGHHKSGAGLIRSQIAPPIIKHNLTTTISSEDRAWTALQQRSIPGPPFLFGACLVALAIIVLTWLPSNPMTKLFRSHSHHSSSTSNSQQQQSKSSASGGSAANLLTPLTALSNDEDDDDDEDTLFENVSASAAKLYRTTRDSIEHRGSSSV